MKILGGRKTFKDFFAVELKAKQHLHDLSIALFTALSLFLLYLCLNLFFSYA